MARNEVTIMGQERARISQILNSPEGLRNPEAARKLALEHAMSAVQARELLSGLPAAENPYVAAMSREAIGIVPAGPRTAPFAMTEEDRRAARREELRVVAIEHNARHGYTRRA